MQAPRRGSCAARKATRQPSCITQTVKRADRERISPAPGAYRSQFQLTSVQISQISSTPDKDYYNGRGWFIRTGYIFTCSYRSLIYIRCPQLWNISRPVTGRSGGSLRQVHMSICTFICVYGLFSSVYAVISITSVCT